jgi:hypothetical protein
MRQEIPLFFNKFLSSKFLMCSTTKIRYADYLTETDLISWDYLTTQLVQNTKKKFLNF